MRERTPGEASWRKTREQKERKTREQKREREREINYKLQSNKRTEHLDREFERETGKERKKKSNFQSSDFQSTILNVYLFAIHYGSFYSTLYVNLFYSAKTNKVHLN